MKNVKHVRILSRVAHQLEEMARDERKDSDFEMEEMYKKDAKDYRDIANIVGCNKIEAATAKYDGLDTASRDYLYDTDKVSDDDVNLIGLLFGYIDDDDLDDDDSDIGGGRRTKTIITISVDPENAQFVEEGLEHLQLEVWGFTVEYTTKEGRS